MGLLVYSLDSGCGRLVCLDRLGCPAVTSVSWARKAARQALTMLLLLLLLLLRCYLFHYRTLLQLLPWLLGPHDQGGMV